jgi:putative ABC transport system permease protein
MQDLRHTLNTLRQATGFTALAVLTLAVGLTLCITVLSVVNAYVIRGLPYPAADRLYRVDYAARGQNPPRGLQTLDWSSLDDVVEFAVAWDLDVFYLLGKGVTEPTPGAWVTPGYIEALGLRAAIGRLLVPDDFKRGTSAAALISHRLWQTRFNGDPNVLGQQMQAYVSDRPDEPEALTIVGVLPADLWHFNAYTEVIAPLRAESYPYLVRLRPGVPAALATQRISTLVRTGLPQVPSDFNAILTSQQDAYTETVRPMLWAVAVSAGLILLIAGANVAVLMLIRGRQREKELAVRLALGATHGRLARLLALEGVVIGTIAIALGLAATFAALRLLGPSFERFLERRVPGGLDALAMDGSVLIGAILCGVATTTLATLPPLVALKRSSLQSTLTLLSRAATDAPGAGRTRAALIAVEIAASLTLLAGAALMAQTAFSMLRVDFGVSADAAVTASLSLRQRSYPTPIDRAAYYDRLLARLDGVAGNTSAALGDWWPLQGSRPRQVETGSAPRKVSAASVFAVSAGYFRTLGMTLLDGRDFDPRDRIGGEPVVVVSQSLARRLWPAASAIGQRLSIHPDGPGEIQEHLVIGVVNDVRQTHADTDSADAYLSLAQRAGRFAFLYLRQTRTATWEAEIRDAVASIDPEIALGQPRSLGLGIEQERAKPRFLAFLLAVFAGFACLLALVGVHGVIAYAVRQRRREIAIRLAIGASGRAITSLFVRQGAVVLAIGMIAGIAGAVALGRVLRSQLFGVEPGDPAVLAMAVTAFGASGIAAIWWPAARGAAADPASVLKES